MESPILTVLVCYAYTAEYSRFRMACCLIPLPFCLLLPSPWEPPVQVMPGVYLGGMETAAERVLTGTIPPLDFRFFVG